MEDDQSDEISSVLDGLVSGKEEFGDDFAIKMKEMNEKYGIVNVYKWDYFIFHIK